MYPPDDGDPRQLVELAARAEELGFASAGTTYRLRS